MMKGSGLLDGVDGYDGDGEDNDAGNDDRYGNDDDDDGRVIMGQMYVRVEKGEGSEEGEQIGD